MLQEPDWTVQINQPEHTKSGNNSILKKFMEIYQSLQIVLVTRVLSQKKKKRKKIVILILLLELVVQPSALLLQIDPRDMQDSA